MNELNERLNGIGAGYEAVVADREATAIGAGTLVYSTNNPDETLKTTPHYTDERFRHAQTVYGHEENGLAYNYSDRLWQWDYAKAEQATETANASGAKPKTARWYQAYLSAYFDKAVEVRHILAGWNVSTGFPYAVFGYRDAAREK